MDKIILCVSVTRAPPAGLLGVSPGRRGRLLDPGTDRQGEEPRTHRPPAGVGSGAQAGLEGGFGGQRVIQSLDSSQDDHFK